MADGTFPKFSSILYRKRVFGLALADLRDFERRMGLRLNTITAAAGLVIGLLADWRMGDYVSHAFPWKTCLAGLIGAAGGPLIVGVAAWIAFRFRAPARLDEQRVADLREAKSDLAKARDAHARELVTLKEAHQAALAKEAEKLALLTKKSEAGARSHAQRAIGNLLGAYRTLEIVSNRTNDDAWNALSQRLEEYKAAYALLPPIARRFHERSEPALTHIVRIRDFERLLEAMDDASDIMLHGECDLDLNISQPNPVVVITKSPRRDRFILLKIIVANREDLPISLYPVWHLDIDPGRMSMAFQADAEPLKEWEEIRREVPRPATPPLPMPLQLSPKSAATGYWCFFIGNSLEDVKQLQNGRRYVDAILEILDLASGRRTKSDRFSLEVELIRPLLPPAPTADNTGEEKEEDGGDTRPTS
jgi:hypothetical protein